MIGYRIYIAFCHLVSGIGFLTVMIMNFVSYFKHGKFSGFFISLILLIVVQLLIGKFLFDKLMSIGENFEPGLQRWVTRQSYRYLKRRLEKGKSSEVIFYEDVDGEWQFIPRDEAVHYYNVYKNELGY